MTLRYLIQLLDDKGRNWVNPQ